MNAPAGDNPEPPAITEVTRRSSHQAPQARPVGIGQSKRGSQEYLAGTVEGAAPRGKLRHQYSWVPFPSLIFASTQLLRPQLPDQLNDRGTDGHEDDGRQNEHHQGRDHFNRSFRSLLFGALAALGAERVGVHAKRLGNAGTEAVGLDESGDQGANIVNPGADHQIAKGLGARLSGTHLKIDQMKFVAQIGVGIMQIAADAHHGLIEGESGFDAYHCEIEGVSQTHADALLATFNHVFQGKTRDEKAQAGYSCEQEETVES